MSGFKILIAFSYIFVHFVLYRRVKLFFGNIYTECINIYVQLCNSKFFSNCIGASDTGRSRKFSFYRWICTHLSMWAPTKETFIGFNENSPTSWSIQCGIHSYHSSYWRLRASQKGRSEEWNSGSVPTDRNRKFQNEKWSEIAFETKLMIPRETHFDSLIFIRITN